MSRIAVATLTLILSQNAVAETLTKVRLDFVEALAPRDTTSSVRFQKDYEGAIDLGKSLLKSKLAKCGYELDTKNTFYEASDALKAKEIAGNANSDGSWLIVGPRRSNHYLLLAQGADVTPTISLMASADDISKLGNDHTSLSPSNSDMARIAATEAKKRIGKNTTYVSVVSDECTACVDFSKAFDVAASRIGLKKLNHLSVRGESFDLDPIRKSIISLKPSIVLLPNYSMVAARVMSAFNSDKRPPLFVGSDGWGDQRYGFVQSGVGIDNVLGITVRGFPPSERGLKSFPLGKEASTSSKELLFTGPVVAILKILDETASSLCKDRPKTRQDFRSSFAKVSSSTLRSPWGVSIYELRSGETLFKRTVRAH